MLARAARLPAVDRSDDAPEPVARWVAAARAGDSAAFGELYRRYARLVHGVLLARVARSDAEDLTQEVFLLAFRRLAQLRDGAAFGGWVAALARHVAIDHLRRPATRAERAPLPEDLAAQERSDGEGWRVLAAIRSLPEAYRETLLLRLVEGMTGPEIAAATGLTHASVRVNLSRGMKRLRLALGVAGR